MSEYGGAPEGEEKKKYEDRFSIMHYNDKTQEYKVLSVNPLQDGKGVFLGIRIGTKGQTPQKLTLMLTGGEVANLIMSLTKIYNQDLK
jgi:hypothetical protein